MRQRPSLCFSVALWRGRGGKVHPSLLEWPACGFEQLLVDSSEFSFRKSESPSRDAHVSETCALSSGTETLYTATLRLSHREAATWALFRYCCVDCKQCEFGHIVGSFLDGAHTQTRPSKLFMLGLLCVFNGCQALPCGTSPCNRTFAGVRRSSRRSSCYDHSRLH